VIDRRADEGQSEGHVDATAEACVLEHGQSLIVIHRQDAVGIGQACGVEQRVRGQRTFQAKALGTQGIEHRAQDLDLLAPEMTALAGVRVEACDENARTGDAETAHEVCMQDAQRRRQRFAGDGSRHLTQRQMRRRERHPQPVAHQHHHDTRHACALGQKLGVAGERNAGVVDHPLVHRCGHHGIVASAAAASDRILQGRQHGAGVAQVELPRLRGVREGYLFERPVGAVVGGADR